MTRPMSLGSRVRRGAAGTALILLAILGIGAPWTWAGSVPLIAGAIGWCPFQALRTALFKRGSATSA